MGVTKTEIRSSNNDRAWGIEKGGVRYDELDIIQSILLPESFYSKEFDILQDRVNVTTVHIEKRQHLKTGKPFYVAIVRFYTNDKKEQLTSLAVKWISVGEFTRLTSLH